jgi:hypothetical protein
MGGTLPRQSVPFPNRGLCCGITEDFAARLPPGGQKPPSLQRSNPRSLRLLNDLVGDGDEVAWHGEAERLRGFEVDCEFERVGCTPGRSPGLPPFRIRPT